MPHPAHQAAGVPVLPMEASSQTQAPQGEIKTTEDTLGFSIPLTAEERRYANLRRAIKKAKNRGGHLPENMRHFLSTAEIIEHADGGATIVWKE